MYATAAASSHPRLHPTTARSLHQLQSEPPLPILQCAVSNSARRRRLEVALCRNRTRRRAGVPYLVVGGGRVVGRPEGVAGYCGGGPRGREDRCAHELFGRTNIVMVRANGPPDELPALRASFVSALSLYLYLQGSKTRCLTRVKIPPLPHLAVLRVDSRDDHLRAM